MTFAVANDGAVRLCFDSKTLSVEQATQLAARLAVFARSANKDTSLPLSAVQVLDDAELERLLRTWNDTETAPIEEPCVHRQFAREVAARPDHPALSAATSS